LQEPLMPELGVVIDLVVVFDGIDVDEIKAFAQSGRVGQNFRVGGNAVYFSNDALAGFLTQHEIEEKHSKNISGMLTGLNDLRKEYLQVIKNRAKAAIDQEKEKISIYCQ